jgi:hypothetical protein
MSKDGALNKDSFGGDSKSCSLFLGNMFPLFATISTSASFDFIHPLFS